MMFLLPNGDVFYAGSEDAVNPGTNDGRILVIDYNAPPNQWEWSGKVIQSEIIGGSAAMYLPGKILKSGGSAIGGSGEATNLAETIDLSCYDSGGYDGAPSVFFEAAPMTHPRHFHNLTILPNGDILAIGGNSFSNGMPGEHPNNPCEVDGQRIDEIERRLLRRLRIQHDLWT